MKTFTLPDINPALFFRKDLNAATTRHEGTNAKKGKPNLTTTEYFIGVLGESLKQNFLGADIDMEFLTLTVRSYAMESVKAVRKLIGKAANGRHIN